jgi:glyoxylase-like metal-dependent hydrolase (beta-lactamase superfamily II)
MNGRRIGNLTITRALELHTSFDRFMFFPQSTKADWAEHLSWLTACGAVDAGSLDLVFPMQSYVLRTSHHTILLDTCVGNHKERPNRPAWHQKTDTTYIDALAAHGLAPKDIDYVMCTHMHGDHVGWNTRLVDGRWVPTFPNARYVFSRKELEVWRDQGHPNFSRQPLEDSVLPVVEAGQAELVDNDFALDDEVWLEPSPGHTPDHVSVKMASAGHEAVMCGDLMHSPIQCLYPEWDAWPDFDPALAKITRRRFLERYCDTATFVCTAHFPLPSVGRVISRGGTFGFEYEDAGW